MTDPINVIKPGVPLSDAQKAELATANAASSEDAQRMAADARARDEREAPLGTAIANSVLEKLKSLPPEEPAA